MDSIVNLDYIKNCINTVAKTYGLKKVSLFGSYARGNQTNKSDIDLLVEFIKPAVSLFVIYGLKHELEEMTKKQIDVVHSPIPDDSFLEIDKEVLLYGA